VKVASSSSFTHAIDWAALPEDVRDTIRELGIEIGEGASRARLAEISGYAETELSRRIGAVRAAIVEQLLERSDGLDAPTRERLFVEADTLTRPH